MPRQRGGEIAAGLQTLQDIVQSIPQQRVMGRLRQAAQSAQQRQAGLGDRVHLPREQHQVGGGWAACAEALQQVLQRRSLHRVRRDFKRRDAEIQQSRRHRVDRVGLGGGLVVAAMVAIRDSEVSAQSMGINLAKYKTLAFAISAGITGLAGALFAHYVRFLAPDAFDVLLSVQFVTIVFVGGLG